MKNKLNINYFGYSATCKLSVSLSNLDYGESIELNDNGDITELIYELNNVKLKDYIELEHALNWLRDIPDTNFYLKESLKEIGKSNFIDNYTNLLTRYNLAKEEIINRAKFMGANSIELTELKENEDLIDEKLKSTFPEIYYRNIKSIKDMFRFGHQASIEYNIKKEDIEKSLANQERSIDIHIGYGRLYLNFYEETSPSKDYFRIENIVNSTKQSKLTKGFYYTPKYAGKEIKLGLKTNEDIDISLGLDRSNLESVVKSGDSYYKLCDV